MSRDAGILTIAAIFLVLLVIAVGILIRLIVVPTATGETPADVLPTVPVVTATPEATLWIATLTVTPTATSLPAMLIVSETPPTVTVTVTRAPTETPTPTPSPRMVQRG